MPSHILCIMQCYKNTFAKFITSATQQKQMQLNTKTKKLKKQENIMHKSH